MDKDLCRTSTLRYQKSAYFPTIDGLFYSYATCGGSYTEFEAFQLIQEASEKHQLTVVIPSVAYAP